jgi:hypothetical protein
MRRPGGIIATIVVIWLVIGAIACFQRGYLKNAEQNCATAATIAVTVLAGPLNYINVNPKVDCKVNVPQPVSAPTTGGEESEQTIGVAS